MKDEKRAFLIHPSSFILHPSEVEDRMSVTTLTIDGKLVSAAETATIFEAARENGVKIPTLCHLEGLSDVGACRICLVEIKGSNRLQPSCLTHVAEGMEVQTNSERLREYRRMIVELLFAERNHVCSVCVANGACELQDLAVAVGMDHVRYEYLNPKCDLDVTHDQFGIDHNRCILCTRCVRVCDEVEGAHTWDVANRGTQARVITDLHQAWGDSSSCTSCGKCVQSCPTGALFRQGATVAEVERDRTLLAFLMHARKEKQWLR
jgi:bidirectional [NiFe] hydrogenase diaphorase subunit